MTCHVGNAVIEMIPMLARQCPSSLSLGFIAHPLLTRAILTFA